MKKVITAIDISAARKAGATQLVVPAGGIVTPQAADDARGYGITLVREGGAYAASRSIPAASAQTLAPPSRLAAPDSAAVAEVRRQVLAKVGAGADPARVDEAIRLVFGAGPLSAEDTPYLRHAGGVTQVRHAALPAGASSGPQAVPGGVQMIEALVPAEGSPGVSYMSWEQSSFAWTFPQAEVLVVLEGELRLTCEGNDLTALAGDALRIAAGSAVTLAAKNRVRCVLSSWATI